MICTFSFFSIFYKVYIYTIFISGIIINLHHVFFNFQAASSVFATAVDEQTLDDAKRRQQTLFQPESWEPVSKYSPGMQEIIDARANEQ